MPLPGVVSGKTRRCKAMCKARRAPCNQPAAFGMPVCRYHGARKPDIVKRGANHPQYRHGGETLEAKTERGKKIMKLRELEALSFALGLVPEGTPKWRGRKPKLSHRFNE